jgi:peptide/nickel transport system substrate-binding protein
MTPIARRTFLGVLAASGAGMLPSALVACGQQGASPAPSASGGHRGTLRVAENIFPASLDGDVSVSSYTWMSFGAAEALTRVTPQMKVVPWLAEKVEQVSATKWRITLRARATFSDGSPVDAAAVKASIERSMERQGGLTSLIPQGSTITAGDGWLEIATPVSTPMMSNALASYQLAIKKVAADGSILYTGPFVPTQFINQTSVTLLAYDRYHGGVPGLKSIQVTRAPDVAARVLALQSGDVDMAQALLPSDVETLQGGGFTVNAFPFARQDDMILNVTRAPLDDAAVRRAITLAIDRQALVKGVMNGAATPAYALAPSGIGLRGLVDVQKRDLDAARRALDGAGWRPAADGVRARAGRRLAFKIGSYSSRAELQPLSIAIRDQLKAVGMAVEVETFPDTNGNSSIPANAFDAAMYSYVPAPFGDIGAALSILYLPGSSNKDRYHNPKIDELAHLYARAGELSQGDQLMSQAQRLIGDDAPVAYILNPYQIVASSKKVRGYTPHPIETYKYDAKLAVGE